MPRKKAPKASERLQVDFHFSDGEVMPLAMIEVALSQIRQWVAIEGLEATTPEAAAAREAARAKLRKVAELAINHEYDLFRKATGGAKGAKTRKGAKTATQDAILSKAAERQRIGTAAIAAIAKETNTTTRTVRDTLSKAGRYKP